MRPPHIEGCTLGLFVVYVGIFGDAEGGVRARSRHPEGCTLVSAVIIPSIPRDAEIDGRARLGHVVGCNWWILSSPAACRGMRESRVGRGLSMPVDARWGAQSPVLVSRTRSPLSRFPTTTVLNLQMTRCPDRLAMNVTSGAA